MACSRRAGFQSLVVVGRSISADDQLHEAVEQVVLVADVPIQRHRVDAELLSELAHAQRLDAASIGEIDGGLKHPLLAQRRSGFGWLFDQHG